MNPTIEDSPSHVAQHSLDAGKVVRDFTESWILSDEAAGALVGVIEQVCRDVRKEQAETDASIAESFQYSTSPNPYRSIARAILREAGITRNRRKKTDQTPQEKNGDE